jgi:hypothetical protein
LKVKFQSKEESKKQQQEAFLKLSRAERFFRFLEMSRAVKNIMPIHILPTNFIFKKCA